MRAKPIVALDFSSKNEMVQFLQSFEEESLYVKVGMELFYKEGPSLLSYVKDCGHEIFLDLKLHDIPNTVYSAMKVLAQFEVDMVNVHAAGGLEMMRAAIKGLEEGTLAGQKRPKIIAVTQLTSTSEEQMQEEQLIDKPLKDSVLHYAALAQQAGLDGVVCSALEAREIRNRLNESFLRVTPGIRLAGDVADDQKRIVGPREANELGSTHIVVGRSITKAQNPYASYKQVNLEWEMN
ncbi:orotidine-5'-phosphate decarboxylase [Lederbergia galactosidilytica]|uniref:Orotidine 5'-phosphate decarboxylase n=1 Tax=Lederbergia galactosidilytica TaxID=217031 RepID=A0A177ZXF2_9BACI|nr:orotidine-5'-phosphate decarboxylase [Lederbergia galactosidilytica]OAK72607.1 orotidine 5'-phosphate decarboxylase [Lederbergia galactosidilytica]